MKTQTTPRAAGRKSAPRAPGNGNGAHPVSPGKRIADPKSELEQAVQRYVDLFEFAPIGYVSFDRIGGIAEVNLAAARMVGWSRKLLIGFPFAMCVVHSDTQRFLHHLLRCRASEARVETELPLRRKNGARLEVLLSSTPTRASMRDGVLLYQTAIIDLTERKRAEKALRQSQERYRTLFDLVPVAVYTCDADGLILEFNQRAVALWGREPKKNDPKERFCGSFKIFYPDGRIMPHKKCPMARALRGEKLKPADLEIIVERKNGARRHVVVNPTVLKDERGKVTGAINTLHDVTERKQAEIELRYAKDFLEARIREQTTELQDANTELKKEIERRRGLEGKILEISDREQQRLGTELHDGLCQHLTATAFMARATGIRLKNHRVIQVEDLQKIAELINNAAADARDIARGLHRVDVDAGGLVKALQDLVDRELWRTPCRLEVKPSFHFEDDAAAAHLYRIAREAVINANKHAQAREVVVKLGRSRDGVVLSVTDDGVGVADKSDKTHGLGFHIMTYRARAAGGRLEVESPKQGGTRIACYIPNSK